MKEEKRKTDLRIGGMYEDIALIRHLHLIILEAYSLCSLVREFTNFPCTTENTFEECVKLHQSLFELQNLMKERVPIIWPKIIQEGCVKCIEKDNKEDSVFMDNIHLLGKFCKLVNNSENAY